MLGVVAECELGFHDSAHPGGDEGTDPGKSTKEAPAPNRKDRTQRAARQALEHYNKFIVTRPGSYWGHYRAAAVSYGLGGGENLAAAASHLEQCLQQRPNNPMLHSHLAASLMALDRHREAQREIEIAIETVPIWPSFTGRPLGSGRLSDRPLGSPKTWSTSSYSETFCRAWLGLDAA